MKALCLEIGLDALASPVHVPTTWTTAPDGSPRLRLDSRVVMNEDGEKSSDTSKKQELYNTKVDILIAWPLWLLLLVCSSYCGVDASPMRACPSPTQPGVAATRTEIKIKREPVRSNTHLLLERLHVVPWIPESSSGMRRFTPVEQWIHHVHASGIALPSGPSRVRAPKYCGFGPLND